MTDKKTDKGFQKDLVQLIPIKEIKENPHQARIYMDKERLDNLAESIKEHGILQPILVRKEEDHIFLVAGQRRLKAAKQVNLTEIPVYFIQDDPLEIGLIENLQREDLHPIDESEGLWNLHEKRIKDKGECTQEELSLVIGKAQNTVSEILSVMKLPELIRKECRKDPRWTRKLLLKIARKKTEEKMLKAYEKAKKRMEELEQEKETTPKSNKNEMNAAVAVKRIDLLQKSFEKMDLGKVRAKRKEEIKTKLAGLKEYINQMLKKFE
jgi:ParB family chromosome partitioning protein